MAKQPTLTNIASGFASQTQLNSNFDAIRDAFNNTISRDGSSPNAMQAPLDMNGNPIVNVSNLFVGGVDILTLVSLGIAAPEVWETGKTYQVRNSVFEDNKFYLCVEEHTSGVFATDLASGFWLLLADFTLANPVSNTLTITGTGLATGGGDLTTNRTIDVAVATQGEAQAGVVNNKAMTPLRTAEAISALQRPIADQAEAQAGTDNDKLMTPLRTAEAIAALTPPVAALTQTQAEAPSSTVFGTVSGQRLAQSFDVRKSSRFFTSTISVAANTNYTINVGFAPRLVNVYLTFTSAAGGYSIGDKAVLDGALGNDQSSLEAGFACAIRSNSLVLRTYSIVKFNQLNTSSRITFFDWNSFNLTVEVWG